MDSTFKLLVVLMCTALLFIGIGLYIITYSVEEESLRYKDQVGTQVILDGDTLTVIDYSMWTDSFTLTGGVTVDSKLVFNE